MTVLWDRFSANLLRDSIFFIVFRRSVGNFWSWHARYSPDIEIFRLKRRGPKIFDADCFKTGILDSKISISYSVNM